MYSIQINGFKTKEEAKEFLIWYMEQGEQDIDIWLQDRDMGSMFLDARKQFQFQDNKWIAELEQK